MLKSGQGMGSTSDAPVPVMVAGTAMVAIKCISVVLLLGELGVDGAQEFVNTSAQAWDSTLIFLAGLMLLCLQISCGFAVMRGRNWGRWGYVVCQCIVVLYLLLATIGSVFPRCLPWKGNQRPNPARSDPAKDPRRGDPGVAVRPYRQPPLLRRAQVRF